MASTTLPPLDILGTYQDPLNLDQGAGKLVNVRAVPRSPEEGKPGKVRLIGTPGLTTVCKPKASACIALCHALGNIWSGHADGSIFYGVETATPLFAGTVAVDPVTPIIRFAEDRTALAIAGNHNPVTGGGGIAYTATQAGGVHNAGFDASINFDPSAVAELDNMTIWGGASNFYANQNAKMYRSQPLAPGTVNSLWFATKEARADALLDLAVSGRVVWPLGSRSCENWYDAADGTDFPFSPFPNSMLSVGLAVRSTLAILRDVIGFVGTDKRLWRCTGQAGQAVSPSWIDLLLQSLTPAQLATLTGYAYGQGGSDFYVLTLPGQWTLEVSTLTGIWSYRQSPGRNDHAARCAAEHDGGVTYVGLDTGEICTLNLNSATEPAGTIARTVITPWLGAQAAKHTLDQLDITSSMGPAAGTFQLDWSDDGAKTWRGARQITFPTPGTRRAIARQMGTARRRQLRVQYSGTTAPFELDEFFATISPGN